MNHTPGAGSLTWSAGLQSSGLPLHHEFPRPLNQCYVQRILYKNEIQLHMSSRAPFAGAWVIKRSSHRSRFFLWPVSSCQCSLSKLNLCLSKIIVQSHAPLVLLPMLWHNQRVILHNMPLQLWLNRPTSISFCTLWPSYQHCSFKTSNSYRKWMLF